MCCPLSIVANGRDGIVDMDVGDALTLKAFVCLLMFVGVYTKIQCEDLEIRGNNILD